MYIVCFFERNKPVSMIHPIVRRALASDLPGIWEVRYGVTENTLPPGRISDEEVLESMQEKGCGWVVESEGRIAGFAIGITDTGNVWALFVHPDFQGQGIGHALHEEMMRWFSTQAVNPVWLTTGTTTRARAFYEAHGWINCGPSGDREIRYERPNAS